MRIHVGKRIWKTAIAVLVCFLIYIFRQGELLENGVSYPFFSTITAILCMQPYVGNTRIIALNQLIGTFLGAAYGILALGMFKYFLPDANVYMIVVVISIFIVPVIKTTVLLKKPDMSHLSCVVFISICMYIFNSGDPFNYVMDRTLDTVTGIVVALIINSITIPRRRRKELLFISGLDDALLRKHNGLSSYSKIELNKMIDDGMNFTVSTEQTPASLIEFFDGIDLNLPVIAMNGAVLYDISRNQYLHKFPLPREIITEIDSILVGRNTGCFYNTLIQNTLLIYFEDFKNMVMQEIYRDLRKSPYRNYIRGRLPENVKVLYLYIIDETQKIESIAADIQKSSINRRVRLVSGREEKYNNYSYLKIYSSEATIANMINHLKQIVNAKTVITFGKEEGKYDFIVANGDEDKVVRIIKSLFRPFIWKK